MDVHIFGADAFAAPLQDLEEVHPGITAEFRGTLLQLTHNPFFGIPLAGATDYRFSFLYDRQGQRVGVVVTSISKSSGSTDVEIEDVCSYQEWIANRQDVVINRLGLG